MHGSVVDPENAARRRINGLHDAGAVDHHQARRQALDDLTGQSL